MTPARYKGAYGGRGSGKSHFFAGLLVEECIRQPGLRAICIRETQRDLKESAKLLIEDKIRQHNLLECGFTIYVDRIETPGGGLILFKGMQDYSAQSIKSLEGFGVAWIEEAQTLSHHSLAMLRPTIRLEGSEIWASWNPRRKTDAIDEFLRGGKLDNAIVVEVNWNSNPWFTDTLEAERQLDLKRYPERYDHIWEGDYVRAFDGAYFAALLANAKAEGRITRVAQDPLLPLRAFWDLGGAGATADAVAIWIAQWIGQEIRVLDYIEGIGQVLAYYVDELRRRGYQRAICHLPHDGINTNAITGKRYEDHLRDAEFEVPPPVKNQGRGAATQRIEAVRRLAPQFWFNEATTEAGRDALGYYHERRDENRAVGLGPEHDWCLAAGTQVLTPEGWRDVEAIRVHDQVLTPCGPRAILRSGIVRETDQWVTVKGVRCTPEHRFFTSRGLVEAGALSLAERLWTRGSLGLSILAFLSATFRFGLKAATISATPKGRQKAVGGFQCSFTAWSMRLCMAQFRRVMRFITSTIIRSTTIPIISLPFPAFGIAATTNRSLDTLAPVASVASDLDAITHLARDAVKPARERTTRGSNASGEPAYNLTVDVDECYFVQGDDGLAYLVSNSSHAADALGLLAICYEAPNRSAGFGRKLTYQSLGLA